MSDKHRAFLKAVEMNATTRNASTHYLFKCGAGVVAIGFLEKVRFNQGLYIDTVYCTAPGKGYGTQIMQTVTSLADLYDVTLWLHPETQNECIIPQHVLERWYRDFGFTQSPSGWVRQPNKGKQNEHNTHFFYRGNPLAWRSKSGRAG